MKKIILSITTLCLLTISASAQKRVFDNFDTTGGVRVVTPTVQQMPTVKPKKTKTGDRRLVQKTSQTTMSVQDGVSTKNSKNTNAVTMTMGAGTALRGFTTGSVEID